MSIALEPTAMTAVTYAGFWRRLAAFLIDGLLLSAVQTTISFGAIAFTPQNYSFSIPTERHAAAMAIAWDIIAIAEKVSNIALICWAITWAYFAILESSPARATIGKRVLGLYVGDVHGDPISFWRASVRFYLKSLSTAVLMIGWLMAAFTPRKQALHDMLAGTLVLREVTYVTSGPGNSSEPGDYWDGMRWVTQVPLAQER